MEVMPLIRLQPLPHSHNPAHSFHFYLLNRASLGATAACSRPSRALLARF